MGRYPIHQVDGNADEIYKAARKLGFSVEIIHAPVDSIWGIYDQTVAVEVKLPNGKLEPKQEKFFKTFKGAKVIVRDIAGVMNLYTTMRKRHDAMFSGKDQ